MPTSIIDRGNLLHSDITINVQGISIEGSFRSPFHRSLMGLEMSLADLSDLTGQYHERLGCRETIR